MLSPSNSEHDILAESANIHHSTSEPAFLQPYASAMSSPTDLLDVPPKKKQRVPRESRNLVRGRPRKSLMEPSLKKESRSKNRLSNEAKEGKIFVGVREKCLKFYFWGRGQV